MERLNRSSANNGPAKSKTSNASLKGQEHESHASTIRDRDDGTEDPVHVVWVVSGQISIRVVSPIDQHRAAENPRNHKEAFGDLMFVYR
jgi:hypothetical protein